MYTEHLEGQPYPQSELMAVVTQLGYEPREVRSVTLDPHEVVVRTVKFDEGEPHFVEHTHKVTPR